MIKPTKIQLNHSRWRCSRFGQSWFDASRVASFEQPAMGNNGVLGRVPECPWPRPRRSTRRPRCRRSSWGRGRENLSKSNAIELALMAKTPPSIYNLRGKHQFSKLGIQCDWHILSILVCGKVRFCSWIHKQFLKNILHFLTKRKKYTTFAESITKSQLLWHESSE